MKNKAILVLSASIELVPMGEMLYLHFQKVVPSLFAAVFPLIWFMFALLCIAILGVGDEKGRD